MITLYYVNQAHDSGTIWLIWDRAVPLFSCSTFAMSDHTEHKVYRMRIIRNTNHLREKAKVFLGVPADRPFNTVIIYPERREPPRSLPVLSLIAWTPSPGNDPRTRSETSMIRDGSFTLKMNSISLSAK